MRNGSPSIQSWQSLQALSVSGCMPLWHRAQLLLREAWAALRGDWPACPGKVLWHTAQLWPRDPGGQWQFRQCRFCGLFQPSVWFRGETSEWHRTQKPTLWQARQRSRFEET